MKTRDTVFCVVLLALLSALGLAVWDPGASDPGDRGPVPPPTPVAAEVETEPEPEPPAPELVSRTVPMVTHPAPPPGAAAASDRTVGAIRGHISLSADVVQELSYVHVRVREAINGARGPDDEIPFLQTVKEEIVPELGTPQFFYDGIPFSDYGYVVRAFAPGFNSGEQFVRIDAENPVADVVLTVTGGVPFSVILRDQMRNPVSGEHVFMVPVGPPRGRSALHKESDNYGVAVFADVLEGKYDVRVGANNAQYNDPTEITVIAHGGVRSVTVEVPHGFDLNVFVQTAAGWGVEGANLMMYSTEDKTFRKYEGVSDFAGKYVFPHLPPGEYQLNVTCTGYEHWGRTLVVPKDNPPPEKVVRLIPR